MSQALPGARGPAPVSSTDELGAESDAHDELAAVASTAPVDGGLKDYYNNYLGRLRGGDMGSLPAVAGLLLLVVLFSALQPVFHTVYNLANMFTEGAGPIFIAMGIVFVLLLGEIDLSAGTAGGVSAFLMARLAIGFNTPWPVSIGAGLLVGVVIGFTIGWLVAKLRIPSFVVTLAFFLAFQGVGILISNWAKGPTGSIPINDKVISDFTSANMPTWSGWLMAAIVVAGYAYVKLSAAAGRRSQGLVGEPMSVIGVKVAALAVVAGLGVYALNLNRATHKGSVLHYVNGKYVKVASPALEGVPWVVPFLIAFFVVLTFILSRTRYGLHIYAVGGNQEAARRAGISVDRIRISVFVICSLMAAVGGIEVASNVGGVAEPAYNGNILLLAVGAAVIGGTSLFGGKGRVLDAIIGGAVIEVVQNGLSDLVKGSNGPAVQYIVTGAVLLLAAAVDALSRRRAGASGLA
jgi:D-xylose transport system permease protein